MSFIIFFLIKDSCIVPACYVGSISSETTWHYLPEILPHCTRRHVKSSIATFLASINMETTPLGGRGGNAESEMVSQGLAWAAGWTEVILLPAFPECPTCSICFLVLKCSRLLSAIAQNSLSLLCASKTLRAFLLLW